MHNLKMLVLIFLLLGLNPTQVGSQTSEDFLSEPNKEVTLTIKPHICIAPRGELSCISRIDVFWKSIQLTDICLHVSLSPETLQCWQQSKSGMYQHKVTIMKNLDYWMTSMNQQLMRAKSSVKFAALKPHRKQKRRRNHLPWSIQSL